MKEWELKAALDQYFAKFEMVPLLFPNYINQGALL